MGWTGKSRACAVSLALLSVAACSLSSSNPTERIGRTDEPIIGGTDSASSQNFVVFIVHPVADSPGYVYECSGILVAPNLVLTARHCVSDTLDQTFTCDSGGVGSSGGAVGADFAPSSLWIFTGLEAPAQSSLASSSASAVGVRLFHDDATNLCNHDVALIGLDRFIPSTDAESATLRLDSKPSHGELFTAVGWGLTSSNQAPSVRQQRARVPILHIGPYSNSDGEEVPPNEFDVGEVVCEGDSGSPALDETNAVIGVASRGGNDLTPMPDDLAASCEGADTLNLYSQTAAFKEVILGAFKAMGQTPDVAGRAPFGSFCKTSSECSSNVCIGSGDAGYCTQACSTFAPCPGGHTCDTVSGQQLCKESPSSSGGCAVSPSIPTGNVGIGLFGIGLALSSALRRSRRLAAKTD